jgi:hypothetical protein
MGNSLHALHRVSNLGTARLIPSLSFVLGVVIVASPGYRRAIVGSVYLGLCLGVPLFALWLLGVRPLLHRQDVPSLSGRGDECELRAIPFLTAYREVLPAVSRGMKVLNHSRKQGGGPSYDGASADAPMTSAIRAWRRDDYVAIGERFGF